MNMVNASLNHKRNLYKTLVISLVHFVGSLLVNRHIDHESYNIELSVYPTRKRDVLFSKVRTIDF